MSKYVPDILSRRWVIISEQRLRKPDGFKKKHLCPFCPGHEKETPAEVFRFGRGEPNTQGWQVRVIPNKYSITDLHEVIIHSPSCDHDIESLALAQVELIFKAYRERYNFYKKRGQVFIFCNHGQLAGASLTHPHSQLVVIPSQINLDTLPREPLNNLVEKNRYFNVYCPDFSQWPYEAWIAPFATNSSFGDIKDEEIKDLVVLMQNILRQLERVYKKTQSDKTPFGYNYYIFPKENWYIRIIPRFIQRAGFELGTGLSVNVVDPLHASLELKGIDEKTKDVLHKLKKKI